jgi:hypothetical protein
MVTPDISDLDIRSNVGVGDFSNALKDYFDQSITDVSNASNIDGYSSNHNSSPVSDKFELVNNTNSFAAFTISPLAAGESFHINVRYDSGFVQMFSLIDPQSGVTDAGDDSNFPTISSTGEPEESGIRSSTLFNISHEKVTIVEFDDAIIFLPITASNDGTKSRKYVGKHYRYLLKSFNQNLNGFSINGDTQFDLSNWAGSSGRINLQNGWVNDNLYVNPGWVQELNVPGASNQRTAAIPKYFFKANFSAEPGTVIRAGASNTSFVHIGSDPTTKYDEVIPWDPDYSPIFS